MNKADFFTTLNERSPNGIVEFRLKAEYHGYGQFARPAVVLHFGPGEADRLPVVKATVRRGGANDTAFAWQRTRAALTKYVRWLKEWEASHGPSGWAKYAATFNVGDRVRVLRDQGGTTYHTVTNKPWMLGHGEWVIGLSGVSGGFSLRRVHLWLEPGPQDTLCRRCRGRKVVATPIEKYPGLRPIGDGVAPCPDCNVPEEVCECPAVRVPETTDDAGRTDLPAPGDEDPTGR